MNHNNSDSNHLGFTFLDFFAGSGLVTSALRPFFEAVWANDICEKKGAVYEANHGNRHLHIEDIQRVSGVDLPNADLAWASFPCQDLSLAGLNGGIHAERSGLVWEWLRIIDELTLPPKVLVAENVIGLVSSKEGEYYRTLHNALRNRGYVAGAVVLDAIKWLPQSRPRVFVIAVKDSVIIPEHLVSREYNWLHPASVRRAAEGLEGWIWWSMPEPPVRQTNLEDIVEWDAPFDDDLTSAKNISLIPEAHWNRLNSGYKVAAGYKRTRNGKQVLELRFDGNAGCLRTPKGGSSRQYLVIKDGDQYKTRLLTVRETSQLMGADDDYELPGTYNDGYKAMGDAVAVPVARHLAEHLLAPLAETVKLRAHRKKEVLNVG